MLKNVFSLILQNGPQSESNTSSDWLYQTGVFLSVNLNGIGLGMFYAGEYEHKCVVTHHVVLVVLDFNAT